MLLWAVICELVDNWNESRRKKLSGQLCYPVLRSGSLKWHVMIVRWQKDDGATNIQNNYQPWHHPPPPSSSVFYPSHSSYLKAASASKDKVKLTSFLQVYLHVFNLYTNGIWVFLGFTLTDNVSPRMFFGFQIPRCRKKDRSAKKCSGLLKFIFSLTFIT